MQPAGNALPSASSLREALWRIDPKLHLAELRAFDAVIERQLAPNRLIANLAGFFGLFALMLSGLGLFGILAYDVTQRTREIGLRMALGANVRDVLAMIVRRGVGLAAAGCILGAICVLGLSPLIEGLLFGVHAADSLTFVATIVAMMLVAATACLVPALRAVKVDPQIALRAE